jgi:hypothetical protein
MISVYFNPETLKSAAHSLKQLFPSRGSVQVPSRFPQKLIASAGPRMAIDELHPISCNCLSNGLFMHGAKALTKRMNKIPVSLYAFRKFPAA